MTVSELYTDGSNYTGPVGKADVELSGFHVKDQYFTYATVSHNNTVRELGIEGILGLVRVYFSFLISSAHNFQGFKSISEVYLKVKRSSGSDQLGLPFLYNLFRSNPELNSTISLSLSQISHTRNASMGGSILIGEIQEGFEAIQNQTALKLVPPNSVEWTFPVDSLKVDGMTLDLPAPTVLGSQTHVGLLDSGTSNILVPLEVVRAIYKGIDGAQTFLASPTREVFILPCSAIPPSLTLIIGGQDIPIHPLDLNVVGGVYQTAAGGLVTVCFGGIIATEPVAGVFDFVLGSPFLRNVYSLFDYGNKIRNATGVSSPTVKFLAVTDPVRASAEFNRTRAAQLQRAPPASGDQIAAILNGAPGFRAVNPINPQLGGGKIHIAGSSSLIHQQFRNYLSFAFTILMTFLIMNS